VPFQYRLIRLCFCRKKILGPRMKRCEKGRGLVQIPLALQDCRF
jgi:hypothetical protein